jgi:Ca2+-binding EF-hand superfamily protein
MSSISGIGSSGFLMMQGMQRPDPSKMVEGLFAKIDTSGKGYIEKSDLQSALSQLAGSSNASQLQNAKTAASADEIFKKLDGNSDGKITKDEMSSGLKKLADVLDSQFYQMRMSGTIPGEQGGMPPPPPPGGDNKPDLNKDQLTSISSSLASTHPQRATQMSNLAKNFEAADTNGDGKVSFQEAMAYEQANPSGNTNSSHTSDANAATASDSDARIMKQMLELMQAYNSSNFTSNSIGLRAQA